MRDWTTAGGYQETLFSKNKKEIHMVSGVVLIDSLRGIQNVGWKSTSTLKL
jgi:hypothetical protein